MAERRMMTRKVTDDDNFISLSSSAQALYLHLSMSADDDGFCNQVSVAMFRAHASLQDLGALLEKRYLYQFENGVIVIKHWRMANALRKDRYTPTTFREELAKLRIKENGAYTLGKDGRPVAEWLPDGCQMVAGRLPQDRIDKVRKDKDRSKREGERFAPPTPEDVRSYANENGLRIDADRFVDYYEARGWRLSQGAPMKDWRAAVRAWARRDAKNRQHYETERTGDLSAIVEALT